MYFTTVSLRILFRDVTWRRWYSDTDIYLGDEGGTLLQTSGSGYTLAQQHVPEVKNPAV